MKISRKYQCCLVAILVILSVSMISCSASINQSSVTRSGAYTSFMAAQNPANASGVIGQSILERNRDANLAEAPKVQPSKETRAAKTTTTGTTPAPTINTTAASSTPTTATTLVTYTAEQWIFEIVRLVNVERVKAGLPELGAGSDSVLSASAVRAREIALSYSHTRPNGTSFLTVYSEYGIAFIAAGENILAGPTGYMTPSNVMQAWMNSSGHRANILNPYFKSIGVGYCQSGVTDYFVQLFVG